MSYNPDWDIDRSYGDDGQGLVEHLLGFNIEHFEVKRKRRLDCGFYVEFEQKPRSTETYKPSGMSVTKADYFVYVVGGTRVVILIPTEILRHACQSEYGINAAEKDGDNPTRGRLIYFQRILDWCKQNLSGV